MTIPLLGHNAVTRWLARITRAATAWHARRAFNRRLRAYASARRALSRMSIPRDHT